jgi:hypothetical protein
VSARSRASLRRAGWVAIPLALTVGCGSTVQYSSSAGQTSGLGMPQGTTGTTAVDTTGAVGTTGAGQPGTTGQPVQGSAPAVPGGGSTGSTTGVGTTGTGSLAPGLTGRGFTATTVYIGFGTSDADTYAKNLGISGIAAGDQDAQLKAITDDIQRRGGLAGRKIELVVHEFSTAQVLSDPSTASQTACVHWTQDKPVFAVLNSTYNEVLLACLRKYNTPLIDTASLGTGNDSERIFRETYTTYPQLFVIAGLLGERYVDVSARRLVQRKFFAPWNTLTGAPGTAPMKLGILVPESLNGRNALRVWTKELGKYGIKISDVAWRSPIVTAATSDIQSAVLRFQSDGVTHVIGTNLGFVQVAESQRYRPRYFVAITPRLMAANAPPGSLNGAMGESDKPSIDVEAAQDPGDPSPATTYCKNLMKRAGQSYSDRTVLYLMEATCDAFFFLKAAVDKGGALSSEALIKGMEALGTSSQSAQTWVTEFEPGEHAGGRAVRDLEYQTACRCFVYPSKQNQTASF